MEIEEGGVSAHIRQMIGQRCLRWPSSRLLLTGFLNIIKWDRWETSESDSADKLCKYLQEHHHTTKNTVLGVWN